MTGWIVEYPWENQRTMDELTNTHNLGDERMAKLPSSIRLVSSSVIESRRCLHPTLFQETEETKFLAKFKNMNVITKQTTREQERPLAQKNTEFCHNHEMSLQNTWIENHFKLLEFSPWFHVAFFGWGMFATSRVCSRWSRSDFVKIMRWQHVYFESCRSRN